jgi:hypothetical protein
MYSEYMYNELLDADDIIIQASRRRVLEYITYIRDLLLHSLYTFDVLQRSVFKKYGHVITAQHFRNV